MKSKVQVFTLHIQGKAVPVKVYREYRRDVRASINKSAAILRMPVMINEQSEQHYLQWFRDWIEKQFQDKSRLQHFYAHREYLDGDTLSVGTREYTISLLLEERSNHTGRLLPGRVLELRLSQADADMARQKSIRHLLSRLVSTDYLPDIVRRVNELNHLYFRKPVKDIRLKLNQRTWGSCSSKGNINLSSRLLFAPAEVIDYIIIHELSHLVEMNHSDRFWALVAAAMPDYVEKERWLKVNDHHCQF